MYKILSSFIGVLILVGVAYALVPALFPDTPLLPRIPSGSGTIGWAIARLIGTNNIANYTGTGLIENTLKLDGTNASGYLIANNCIWTDKWIGVDANNKPICGSTSTFIGDFWTIESQDCANSSIYHASGTSSGSTATGDTMKSGDILKTPVGCTVTIAFSDLSILRLDGDTVVSFDIGYLSGGTTIASALLENGSLWWRILTETWSYSVGTREIIAWVRGTSISLTSTGNTMGSIVWSGTGWTIPRTPSPYNTEVTIVDTTTSSGAVIACRKTDGWLRVIPNLARTDSYLIPPGWCGNTIPSVIARPKDTIFSSSPWARRNTVKDLDYMYRKLALSGSTLPAPKRALLRSEIDTTKPEESGTGVTATGAVEWESLCETGKLYWNDRYGCQNNDILAIADYSLPPLNVGANPINLDIRKSDGTIVPVPNISYVFTGTLVWWIDLTPPSAKLEYDEDQIELSLSGGDLRGKTVEIELVEPIDHNFSGMQYFIFLKNNKYLRYQKPPNRYFYENGIVVPNNALPSIGLSINIAGIFTRDASMKIYTYEIPPIWDIDFFIIGGYNGTWSVIQKKIRSIKVWN